IKIMAKIFALLILTALYFSVVICADDKDIVKDISEIEQKKESKMQLMDKHMLHKLDGLVKKVSDLMNENYEMKYYIDEMKHHNDEMKHHIDEMKHHIDEIKRDNNVMKQNYDTKIESLKMEINNSKLLNNAVTEPPFTVYVRWGRNLCPAGANEVYRGYTGGSHYTDQGGASNYECLPTRPQYGRYTSGIGTYSATMYGAEYEV
ncbi:unnamed protein product, partial [Owenia fusiformis]